jgi:hypothetical protein
MASILLVLASSPETPAGQRALGLAESLGEEGHALTLCCLQDGALLASTRVPIVARARLARLLDRGARCVVLGEDLTLRGIAVGEHASPLDYSGMIVLLTGDHDRVLGAF